MMRKLFLMCHFVCLCLLANAQQPLMNATVDIKDAKSGKSIAMGMAANYRASKCYTIANGKLNLPYNKQTLFDTLFIDVQGYAKYKMRCADLINQGKALLQALPKPLDIPASALKKNENLNDYDNQAVFHWIGLPMEDQPFSYLQVGQVYENTYNGAKLNKVRLNQMVLDLPNTEIYDDGSITFGKYITYAYYPSSTIFTQEDKGYMRSYAPSFLQSNKFKLRIYQLDGNNQPIAELCSTPILIDREPPVENMHINLSKYKIILPESKFMIAVEWIATQRNHSYINFTKAMFPMGQCLRPFIGVSEKKGDKLNVMALDYAGNWKPFNYLSPYYTDLAMQCELEY